VGFLIPEIIMQILKPTIHITPGTRKLIVALTLVVTLSSIRVQAASAADVLPEPPVWLTPNGEIYDSPEMRSIVVPVRAPASLKSAEDKPVKKWNTINAPDLTTPVDYSDEAAIRTLVVPTTAYTSDPNETDSTPFTTANGTQVRDGIVAANFLKFGTRIRIPDYFGNKVFVVADRMNQRYNQRVDIWMLTKTEARNWGVRKVKIEILP